jgi:fumarylacetoacetase
VTLRGRARADGYTIGFGDCTGILRPAVAPPYPAS